MADLEQNLVSAAIIALIIAAMAIIKNNQLKALIYSLPIPITVTLVATGGNVNANHPTGLLLASLFLWGIYALNRQANFNIFLSDIIATLAYIGIGYATSQIINVSFYWSALFYLIIWLAFIYFYRRQKAEDDSNEEIAKIRPVVKLTIVFLLAFLLFSLKNYLSDIIVTFPFSGVFAVIEGRRILKTLAATFARNSVAILAMFTVLYVLKDVHPAIKIVISWAFYLGVLKIITVLFPLPIHNFAKGER